MHITVLKTNGLQVKVFSKNVLHFRSIFHKKPRESKKKEEINEPELDENLHMQTENNNRMVCGKKF